MEINEDKAYIFAVCNDDDFYIPDALHIQRNDNLFLCENDKAAAQIAEKDGVKLIRGMKCIPDGLYLDTK